MRPRLLERACAPNRKTSPAADRAKMFAGYELVGIVAALRFLPEDRLGQHRRAKAIERGWGRHHCPA
jgi:hypothetical protein